MRPDPLTNMIIPPEHAHKYNEIGEWDDEVDPAEWVPGDPLPGMWRMDWSQYMFAIVENDLHGDEGCWCMFTPDYMGYKTYRWTPDLPEEFALEEVLVP